MGPLDYASFLVTGEDSSPTPQPMAGQGLGSLAARPFVPPLPGQRPSVPGGGPPGAGTMMPAPSLAPAGEQPNPFNPGPPLG